MAVDDLIFGAQRAMGTSGVTFAANDSTKGVACIYRASTSGTISKIGIFWASRTGTGHTYRVGIEGVSARNPDGTYANSGNAYVDVTTPANGAWSEHTLGATVTVTAGQAYCVTVRAQALVDGTHFNDIGYAHNLAFGQTNNLPYPATLTSAVWTLGNTWPRLVPIYDDGTIERTAAPFTTQDMQANSWGTGTAPLYRGNGIVMPVTKRVIAIHIPIIQSAANSDFKVAVWKEGDSAALASITIDPDGDWQGTSARQATFPLPPTTLNAGSTYFFVVEPTTANAITAGPRHAIFSTLLQQQGWCGNLFGAVGATGSPPTWTKYNNVSDGFRFYQILPVFDQSSAGGVSRARAV